MTDRVNRPDLTPSGQMARFIKDGSLTEFGLRRALRYQKSALQSLATFKGFENMTTPLSAEDLKEKPLPGQLRTKWLNSMIIDACPVTRAGVFNFVALIYDLW